KQKRIAHTQYEEERNKLRAEAWRELEALKEKYDRAFGELERRIEAYLRARKPLLTKHVFSAFKLLNGPPFMWVKICFAWVYRDVSRTEGLRAQSEP
ncbi:MAG: hypothetical protein QXK12_02825, partial [Candidatus Nezhaarchaeales archaeon]